MSARSVARLTVLAVLAAAGCGRDETTSPTALKLRGVARLYLDYTVAKGGTGPADEGVFKKHLKAAPRFLLEENGLNPDELDKAFVSDRDGEPFVVRYGQRIGSVGGTSTQVIAHEKTGKGGRRLVSFVSGKVELADDARLQEVLAGK